MAKTSAIIVVSDREVDKMRQAIAAKTRLSEKAVLTVWARKKDDPMPYWICTRSLVPSDIQKLKKEYANREKYPGDGMIIEGVRAEARTILTKLGFGPTSAGPVTPIVQDTVEPVPVIDERFEPNVEDTADPVVQEPTPEFVEEATGDVVQGSMEIPSGHDDDEVGYFGRPFDTTNG